MKKNYLYITKSGNIKYKNLGIKKKSASALSRKIFNDYLIDKIRTEKQVKFPKSYFELLITELLTSDLSLALKRYSVNNANSYKCKTSITYEIAKKYGGGIHFLIPNTKFGIGKGKRYCTIEEFKTRKLSIKDIDMSNIWSELDYFIIESKSTNLNNWF